MRKISEERLKALEDIEFKMQCLENGGIDNWEWYGEALKPYDKAKEEEELLDNALLEIVEELSSDYHEPSERGAGIAFGEDGMASARGILIRLYRDINKESEE